MDIMETLISSVKTYTDGVAALGGDRQSQQERSKTSRKKFEDNTELVTAAETYVTAMIEMLGKAFNTQPELSCALFQSVTTRLKGYVKDERDMFLNGFDGTHVSGATVAVDLEAVKNARTVAEALFNVAVIQGTEFPEGFPVEDGKLKLPRMPKGTITDRNVRNAATKKITWNVLQEDGTWKQRPGYTHAMMRKDLGVDTVQEIKDVMENDKTILDGAIHKFTMKNGIHFNFQVMQPMTAAEAEAVDNVEDDETVNGEDD